MFNCAGSYHYDDEIFLKKSKAVMLCKLDGDIHTAVVGRPKGSNGPWKVVYHATEKDVRSYNNKIMKFRKEMKKRREEEAKCRN